jgi:NAD(P)-dependent dehydrogenase (short-subunit alcohol dehydrogenase family)
MSRSSSLNMAADDAKVVLVTGSSRGLGRSIALDLGKAGQKVVINYVSDNSAESAAAVVEEIKSLGGDAVAIQADSESSIFMQKLFSMPSKAHFLKSIDKVPTPMPSRKCSVKLLRLLELSMFW